MQIHTECARAAAREINANTTIITRQNVNEQLTDNTHDDDALPVSITTVNRYKKSLLLLRVVVVDFYYE